MTIFVGQKIDLISTITQSGGTPVDITGQTVSFDYWLPGNRTTVPDGHIEADIISGPDGTVSGEFPASLNIVQGDLKFQSRVTIGEDTFRALATIINIKPIGYSGT